MATEYTIPITRRHYAGQVALEAGIIVNQEWAYDETNERIGIRLSDDTYRYIGQSELFPPGAGVNPAIDVLSGGAAAKITIAISTNDMKINTAGASDDKLILGSQETDVLTIDGGDTDIYTTAWTEYGPSSTVVGFSGAPSVSIYYKRVGRLVFVRFSLQGTSNATGISFTLPIACTAVEWTFSCYGMDNGTDIETGCKGYINYVDLTTVTIQPDQGHTQNVAGWTNSGNKRVAGQFWYEASA